MQLLFPFMGRYAIGDYLDKEYLYIHQVYGDFIEQNETGLSLDSFLMEHYTNSESKHYGAQDFETIYGPIQLEEGEVIPWRIYQNSCKK